MIGRQLVVNKKLVARIMTEHGLFGLLIKKVRRGPSGEVVQSRRVVGWSINTTQTVALVTNDHGSQFTSWVFSERALEGLSLTFCCINATLTRTHRRE